MQQLWGKGPASTRPRDAETYVHREACTLTLTATWVIRAKSQSNLSPSVREWMNKNEVRPHNRGHTALWVNLKNRTQSKRSQSQATEYMAALLGNVQNGPIQRDGRLGQGGAGAGGPWGDGEVSRERGFRVQSSF